MSAHNEKVNETREEYLIHSRSGNELQPTTMEFSVTVTAIIKSTFVKEV